MKPLQERLQADKWDEYENWKRISEFHGNDDEYEIATRGTHLRGHIDDNGDGYVWVEWWKDGYEYKVTYQYGYPKSIEKLGLSDRSIAAHEIMHS